MSIPSTVGPNVALVLQRLDLIERKIDWLAERVTWLTYSSTTPTQEGSDFPTTVMSSAPASTSKESAATDVVDGYSAEPSPADTPHQPETTPPASTSEASTASETPWQHLDEPAAQAPVNEVPLDDKAAHTKTTTPSEAPRAPRGEVPPAPYGQEPVPVEPEQASAPWTSPDSMHHAPIAGAASHMQGSGPAGTGQARSAGTEQVPGWAQRAMREGNL